VSEKEISEMRPRANAHVGQDTIKSNAAVAREGLVGNLDWSERGTILAEKQCFWHFRRACRSLASASERELAKLPRTAEVSEDPPAAAGEHAPVPNGAAWRCLAMSPNVER